MRFTVTERVACPRDAVFRIYRDELVDLLPGRGSVARIEVLEQRVDGPRMHSVKRWTGAGVPASLAGALPAGAFQWRDTSTWDAEAWEVRWSHRHERWLDAMRAEGVSRFEDDFGDTLVHLDGDLWLWPERLPGVPVAVGTALRSTLERFLVAQVRSSLRETLTVIAERLA